MRAVFLVATSARTFPAPTSVSAEGKNFSLVTPPGIAVRNSLPAWAKSRIHLGPGEPGTAARRRAAPRGRGRTQPQTRGHARPAGARTRLRRSQGLGRARPPPPQPRGAGIVSSVPAAPCARFAAAAPSLTEGPAVLPFVPPCLRLSLRPSVRPAPSSRRHRPSAPLRLPWRRLPRDAQEARAEAARSPLELAGSARSRPAPPRHLP